LEDVDDEGKLLEREQHHIDENRDTCINVRTAFGHDRQAYQKEYRRRDDVMEKQRIRVRKYHEKNRDKICAKNREKITCECGAVISRSAIRNHRKSKRHLLGIEDLKETVL
jgi:hypothetical protein